MIELMLLDQTHGTTTRLKNFNVMQKCNFYIKNEDGEKILLFLPNSNITMGIAFFQSVYEAKKYAELLNHTYVVAVRR
jgi:hypothetical protein